MVGGLREFGHQGIEFLAGRQVGQRSVCEELETRLSTVLRVPVRLTVTGTLDDLPAGVGLGVYRIVQESIANATRHAQGAAITVALTLDTGTLNLSIENGPRTSDADLGGPGLGQGIPGMAERARTVGGSLSATPTAGGGFAVRAALPARPDGATA